VGRASGPVSFISTASLLAVTTAAPAQTRAAAGLDLGLAHVHYDDFLPSLAAFAALDASVATARTDVTARGAAVRFESGRNAYQAAFGVSHLAPARGRTRVEVLATGGASWYAEFARFAHGLGHVRLHRAALRRGAWLGGSLGSTSYGHGWRPVVRYAVGGWATPGSTSLDVALTGSHVGDTAYADLEATMRWPIGPLALDVWTGARMWSRGGGRGVYGEATLTLPLASGLGAIVSGGRYPTDPVRGTIAGRYLSAGLRVTHASPRRPAPPAPPPTVPQYGSNGAFTALVPTVEITLDRGARAIRVHVAGARTVELVGDLTDWSPVTLTPVGSDNWVLKLPVSPGVRRFAVRVDGGPWLAPAGTRRVFDEFGGEVGLLIVP
jgi:hypothetical protein